MKVIKRVFNRDVFYFFSTKIWLVLKGRLLNNGISAYYCKWTNNFGDLLTPIILKYYGMTPYFAYPNKAKVAVVGTILDLLGNEYCGYILGAGLTYDKPSEFKNAIFYGVRGELTRKNLGLDKSDIVVGDPGILISNIIKFNNVKKIYKIGIIPHESETNDYRLNMLLNKFKEKAKVIYPNCKNVVKVLREINECEYIISSSLHGLIVSDSYGIPNCRIQLNALDDSDSFKFKDYYSSINEELKTIDIDGNESLDYFIENCRLIDRRIISEKQRRLDLMFRKFYNQVIK